MVGRHSSFLIRDQFPLYFCEGCPIPLIRPFTKREIERIREHDIRTETSKEREGVGEACQEG